MRRYLLIAAAGVQFLAVIALERLSTEALDKLVLVAAIVDGLAVILFVGFLPMLALLIKHALRALIISRTTFQFRIGAFLAVIAYVAFAVAFWKGFLVSMLLPAALSPVALIFGVFLTGQFESNRLHPRPQIDDPRHEPYHAPSTENRPTHAPGAT